jgi:hypothetical protein
MKRWLDRLNRKGTQMKLLISKDFIKREIEGPFAMCCSADDLDALIRELQRQRRAMGDSTYGWFPVDPSHPSDCASNTRPLKWTEAGNINPPANR